MARAVQLQTLEQRVLQRANLRTGTAGTAILDAGELDSNINEGIAAFWNVVAEFPEQHWYLQSVNFATTASVDTYPIGSGQLIPITDFYRPQGVDVLMGQNIVNTARRFMWSERNRFKVLYSGWTYTQPVFYSLVGNSSGAGGNFPALKFIPLPSGSFQVTLWYMPTCPTLVSSTDVFDGINGYEEFIVLDAAIKILVKQERLEHAGILTAERERWAGVIRGILGARDTDQPERVTDITINDDGLWGRPAY